jgi:hypothetical protein
LVIRFRRTEENRQASTVGIEQPRWTSGCPSSWRKIAGVT